MPHTHALAPLAREVVRLARHMDHPRCGELAPWVAPLDPTAQAANAAVARAAPALSDAIGKLEKSLGVAPAGKHGSSGRGHGAAAAAARTATRATVLCLAAVIVLGVVGLVVGSLCVVGADGGDGFLVVVLVTPNGVH